MIDTSQQSPTHHDINIGGTQGLSGLRCLPAYSAQVVKNLAAEPQKTRKKVASVRTARNGLSWLPRKSIKVITKAASAADKPKTLVGMSDNSTDYESSQMDQAPLRTSRLQAMRRHFKRKSQRGKVALQLPVQPRLFQISSDSLPDLDSGCGLLTSMIQSDVHPEELHMPLLFNDEAKLEESCLAEDLQQRNEPNQQMQRSFSAPNAEQSSQDRQQLFGIYLDPLAFIRSQRTVHRLQTPQDQRLSIDMMDVDTQALTSSTLSPRVAPATPDFLLMDDMSETSSLFESV